MLLACEEAVRAMRSELLMWIALKDDNPNAAWDYLVEAEMAARTVVQVHVVMDGMEEYISRLHSLEQLLFPRALFFSIGGVVEASECSICGAEYGSCNHLAGEAYMGKVCARVITKLQAVRELSVVTEPANKRCRIYSFSEGGVTRDVMSWREVPKDAGDSSEG